MSYAEKKMEWDGMNADPAAYLLSNWLLYALFNIQLYLKGNYGDQIEGMKR